MVFIDSCIENGRAGYYGRQCLECNLAYDNMFLMRLGSGLKLNDGDVNSDCFLTIRCPYHKSEGLILKLREEQILDITNKKSREISAELIKNGGFVVDFIKWYVRSFSTPIRTEVRELL